MMRLFVLFALLLAAFGLSSCAKTYVYRQRVTVEVNTPDGVKSGFAVHEVTWGSPQPDSPRWETPPVTRPRARQ